MSFNETCWTPSTFILENPKNITDPREIANTFNKYYTSIANKILRERKYEGNKSHTDYLKEPFAEIFVIYQFDQSEVEIIIN